MVGHFQVVLAWRTFSAQQVKMSRNLTHFQLNKTDKLPLLPGTISVSIVEVIELEELFGSSRSSEVWYDHKWTNWVTYKGVKER